MGMSETILAAMIGAIATVGTATFQLVMSWRAASGDRRKRNGMRGLMWVFALMLASFVGGFAYSEYRAQEYRDDAQALRAELNQQLQTLASSAARLEQVRLASSVPNAPPGTQPTAAESDSARLAEERRRGSEGVPAVVHLPACSGPAVAFSNQRTGCTESTGQRVAVCAIIPAQTHVTEVQLYARREASNRGWTDGRVALDQDVGSAKFVDSAFERSHSEATKEVCVNFLHWSSDKGHSARIVVHYSV